MEAHPRIITAQNIAHAISIMTILSCLLLKVPQIKNIWLKRSAEGILLRSMLMEVTGYSIMTLYNFTSGYDIMTYLEYPIILLQVYVLVYLVLKFKNYLRKPIVPLATASYVTLVVLFGFEVLPKSIISYLVPVCTPLSGFAKVTYIYGIVHSGNADAISLATWVISVFTNLARIFTIYVDSADVKLMLNFFISAVLSAGVLLTAMAYQYRPQTDAARRRKSRARSIRRRSSQHEHED